MQRNALLVVVSLLVIAGATLFLLLRQPEVGPVPLPPQPQANEIEAASTAGGETTEATVTSGPAIRQAVSFTAEKVTDPELRAALTGFRGRVVDSRQQPVPDCGVRLFRFAMDSILQPGVDLMEGKHIAPEYLAGDVRTDGEGRFFIDGVWPRAFFLLQAGLDTDSPTAQMLERHPAPGEIVDLGDIVLQDAAVAIGRVVDEAGDPVADALVRGADLPGQALSFFPFERFDPRGFVLVREPNAPFDVVAMPDWVESAFERLPIPTVRTAPDGTFRLVGITPGQNMIVTTKPQFLADVKPQVKFEAGKVRDLGTIRLRSGEELVGRVVDEQDKPIAGADVVAGSTIAIAPVDLASRIGTTDADGRFSAFGFAGGKVTVAARRGEGHPWILAAPQLIAGEVVVTLPSMHGITVRVVDKAGAVRKDAKLRVLRGSGRNGLLEMGVLGFGSPVDLAKRLRKLEDGGFSIVDLEAGKYSLLAQAEGTAIVRASFELPATTELKVELSPSRVYPVLVLDPEGKPLRGAAIYVAERGNRLIEFPLLCGRTGDDGRLKVTQAHSEQVRLSAEHPRYGTAHGEGQADKGEVVLQMAGAATLTIKVTEGGAPAPVGKYTVAMFGRGGTRGATENMPALLTSDLEGKIVVKALQPARYQLQAIESLRLLRSPGAAFMFGQRAMRSQQLGSTSVELRAGENANVVLEVTGEQYTGPTGQIFGTVTVNGRFAEGATVIANTRHGRRMADVANTGTYQFVDLPAGNVNLELMPADSNPFDRPQSLYRRGVELKQAESMQIDITLETLALRGVLVNESGAPVGNSFINAQSQGENGTWHHTRANADGTFTFADLPTGKYNLNVRGQGGMATMNGVVLDASTAHQEVRVVLTATREVSGKVDLSRYTSDKARWRWVAFMRYRDNGQGGGDWEHIDGVGLNEDGTFRTRGIPDGEYGLQVHFGGDQDSQSFWHNQVVSVRGADVRGLELVLVKGPPIGGK